MKTELQNELFDKYPKIFRQKDLSRKETAMCWGIECPDSWLNILDSLCACIQAYIDNNNMEQVEFTQVKEKFGVLRVYTSGHDQKIDGMIWLAESMSGKICARCGSRDNVQATRGWITFLCDTCMKGKTNG